MKNKLSKTKNNHEIRKINSLHKLSIFNDVVQAHMYQCQKCGRKEIIRFDRDKTLCTHCGHYIYKSKELEQKYKFKETMVKELKRTC